jgi:hypothetical protein
LTRARTFIGWEIKSLDKKSLYRATDISYITYIVSNGLARAKTASSVAAALSLRRNLASRAFSEFQLIDALLASGRLSEDGAARRMLVEMAVAETCGGGSG